MKRESIVSTAVLKWPEKEAHACRGVHLLLSILIRFRDNDLENKMIKKKSCHNTNIIYGEAREDDRFFDAATMAADRATLI